MNRQQICLFLILFCINNINCQFRCNQNQQVLNSVIDVTDNTVLGGQLYKHFYGKSYREGTAFRDWQQMMQLFNKSTKICQCNMGQRNTCKYREIIYQGYDYVDNKQVKRQFASTVFVYDCMGGYNYTTRRYKCFLLTAYPQRAATPSWEQYNTIKGQLNDRQDTLIKLTSFCIISYFIWIMIASCLAYVICVLIVRSKRKTELANIDLAVQKVIKDQTQIALSQKSNFCQKEIKQQIELVQSETSNL